MMTFSVDQLARRASEALRARDRKTFVATARVLVSLRAVLGIGWRTIALGLLDFGELSLARTAIDAFAAEGHANAQFERATVYARTGLTRDALTIIDQGDRRIPTRASNAYLRGTLALNMGDLPAAQEALLEAARAMPGSGQIWQTLASTGSMRKAPDLAQYIIRAESAMAKGPDSDRAIYLYALGKTLDDLGEPERAYDAFQMGARLLFAARGYSASNDDAEARRAVEGWNAEAIASIAASSTPAGHRPIFVTGMPRSGSTLVEQILASHSAVVGGEELMRFSTVVREVGASDWTSVKSWAQSKGLDELADLYLYLFSQRFGFSGRAIDKTLETGRYLGMLAAVMPDAPIIWMRRDPLNCAWSCYRTHFLMGLGWSYSQPAIAARMKNERRLLFHWQEVLGARLLVVDYERLVTHKEIEIPRILRHCGLAIEEQVFSPERTKRTVVTASVVQVRSPITTTAINAVAPYQQYMQPFLDSYGDGI